MKKKYKIIIASYIVLSTPFYASAWTSANTMAEKLFITGMITLFFTVICGMIYTFSECG